MNGFMKTTLAIACTAGAMGSIGCTGGERYRNLVDPCRMERYGAVARQEVITCFNPQVQNGQILDQTVWNYQFEPGTDKLNALGQDKLDQLVRRRPEPDPRIFIQTARDLAYNADKPDELTDSRRDLDNRRGAAIQKYLTAQTAGRPMHFDVLIHDPAEVGISGVSARNAILSQRTNYSGVLGSAGGGAGGQQGGQQGGQSSGGATAGGATGGAAAGGGATGGGAAGGSGAGGGGTGR